MLFEQRPQILEHDVFFVGARAISEKKLLAQVQCLFLYGRGINPVPCRNQELISVHLTFSRVPCVIDRSRVKLIERYCFRVPIELRDRIRDQRVCLEQLENRSLGIWDWRFAISENSEGLYPES